MPARDDILAALRAAAPAAVELPDLARFAPARPADLRARFEASVREVGGRCLGVSGELEEELARIPEYAAARNVVSLVPGVRKANIDLAAIDDPHQLRDLDFCLLPGEFGVAENGAVWVTEHGGANRAAAFLAQHLALVLPAAALVADLHEAYQRISLRPGFALFLSGPSKTADIEQALVIGAHGPRSCTVLLTQSLPTRAA